MEKEKEITDLKDKLTIYEVSYLLLPSIDQGQVSAKTSMIHEVLEKVGGQVISQENPTLIDLAYPMTKIVQTVRHKCTKGYFGWVKFEMPKDLSAMPAHAGQAGGIEKVKKDLDGNNDILRYLIIKTVRENTLVGGKIILKKEESPRKNENILDDIPLGEPATQEEIDKSIDDLVIV